MIQEVRESGKGLLILDAGDLLFGRQIAIPLQPSSHQEAVLNAQFIIDAFNVIGCDAVGIGDDDLRLGAKAFVEVAKKASFPFISANLDFKGSSKVSVPYVIKEAGGLRWGIFSLVSANPSPNHKPQDWKVLDPLKRGKEVVQVLKGKADFIILLADMSLEELKELLLQLQGVAFAVAGHNPSGRQRSLQFGQTIVIGGFGWGRYLGRLDVHLKDPSKPFVDEATIEMLEKDLTVVKKRIEEKAPGVSGEDQKRMEAQLAGLKEGNTVRNTIIPLSATMKEDERIKQMVEEFTEKQEKLKKGCQ